MSQIYFWKKNQGEPQQITAGLPGPALTMVARSHEWNSQQGLWKPAPQKSKSKEVVYKSWHANEYLNNVHVIHTHTVCTQSFNPPSLYWFFIQNILLTGCRVGDLQGRREHGCEQTQQAKWSFV